MAYACVEAGAKGLIIFDANQKLGDEAVSELHKLTGYRIPVEFMEVDVRECRAIDMAVQAVVDKHGPPDVLINSAGIAE
jgi:NAD(P)-dependent dehydrogenase (short-subunit alcohol dehydrogenase family)